MVLRKYDWFLANASRSKCFFALPPSSQLQGTAALKNAQLINRWTKSLEDNAEKKIEAMGMLYGVIDSESNDLRKNVNSLTDVSPKQQKKHAKNFGLYSGKFCSYDITQIS
ncbi:MAG: hypothetical protein B9S37_04380 [Verrucomicrobiia bacterium Tous-C3TDCM]|nr:MAG: hypothetical protein B9S37_04380 [Verrucomicrobiae bacterium Tous-C3TDCM]PAZ06887.1 MAG: hypothetical protein CAK88_03030 [Verrucomicrobiae bacterium AMD-G2]